VGRTDFEVGEEAKTGDIALSLEVSLDHGRYRRLANTGKKRALKELAVSPVALQDSSQATLELGSPPGKKTNGCR